MQTSATQTTFIHSEYEPAIEATALELTFHVFNYKINCNITC